MLRPTINHIHTQWMVAASLLPQSCDIMERERRAASVNKASDKKVEGATSSHTPLQGQNM